MVHATMIWETHGLRVIPANRATKVAYTNEGSAGQKGTVIRARK
jgi:hypothetical protein